MVTQVWVNIAWVMAFSLMTLSCCRNQCVAFRFDRRLGSTIDELPVKFWSDQMVLGTDLMALGLREVLQWGSLLDVEIGPWSCRCHPWGHHRLSWQQSLMPPVAVGLALWWHLVLSVDGLGCYGPAGGGYRDAMHHYIKIASVFINELITLYFLLFVSTDKCYPSIEVVM